MGSPQTSTAVVSTPADPEAALSGWAAASTSTEAVSTASETSVLLNARTVQAAALKTEAELTAKITSLEQRLDSVVSALREGLHNRVNELEQTIKRKFPYG